MNSIPNDQSQYIIRTCDVVKDFQNGDEVIRVLHGINLFLNYGELVILAGPSGCGKTTLLSILTGLLRPTKGEVWIKDENITRMTEDEKVLFRRKNIGFIFQHFNLIPSLTACENTAIPLVAAGYSLAEATRLAATYLEKVKLSRVLDKLPAHLSGGEQQRIAIARSLIHDPEVVVCDEPTASLDSHMGHFVMELLKAIAVKPERVVLVVTHDTRIFPFADRILHLNDGYLTKSDDDHRGI